MSYLLQKRNESCVEYALINQHPIDFFRQLFFTNGNGIEISNGNPVEVVNYGRTIPWIEYYKEETTLDDIKDYFVDYKLERKVQETQKMIRGMDSYSNIYKDALAELDDIYELSDNEITNSHFWLNKLLDEKGNFYPYLSLSDGYFKLQQINENTEPLLLDVAIAVTSAYVSFFAYVKINKTFIEEYKSIISFRWNVETLERCYNTSMDDLEMLRKEFKRLLKLKMDR